MRQRTVPTASQSAFRLWQAVEPDFDIGAPSRRVQCDPLQVSVDAPPGWVEKGSLVLSGPAYLSSMPTFTVRNGTAPSFDSPRAQAERRLGELAKHADGFELLEDFDTTIGGCTAACLRFAWNAPFGRAEQTVAFVERYIDGARVRTTITATAPIEHVPREIFAALLESVRFGSACYAPPPRLTPPPGAPRARGGLRASRRSSNRSASGPRATPRPRA
jgi:hypothetical protein